MDKDHAKHVHYEGDLAIYTDPTSGAQYQWSEEKREWIDRQVAYGFEDDTHVYTDKDGVKFFWDKERSAWFPKVDDEFLAQYHLAYGNYVNDESAPSGSKTTGPSAIKTVDTDSSTNTSTPPPNVGEKRKISEPAWFEVNPDQNNKVYVQNLPLDITQEEFVNLMQKFGLVMKDTTNGQYKIKLYTEPGTDLLKGDALCTYIKVESVQLAINLLDGYELRGKQLKVERATFQMKGQYDPKLKPKMRKRKDKEKIRRMQQKLFDWRPEQGALTASARPKHERVVIVENVFEPKMFDDNVSLILELQEDLREEASKLGQVKKVTIYDQHPKGIAQVNMANAEEADAVVSLFDDRWFMKRKLHAYTWDGKTKYTIAETDQQISQRLEKWDQYLEQDGDAK